MCVGVQQAAVHHSPAPAHACPALPAACNNDEAGLTCIWAAIAPGKQRFITITANATTAGVQPSLAAVTTASLDTDAKNNKAGASVTVLVRA